MTMNRIICGALLCVFASIVQAETIIKTDDTWKATVTDENQVSPPDPPSGWNTSVGFDDSLWGTATNVTSGFFTILLNGEATDGLWFNGLLTTGPTTIWLRKVFTISTTPTSAVLSIVVDDDADVFLNGNLVIHDGNGSAGATLNTDVTSFITPGQNLVAAKAKDSAGGNHFFALRLGSLACEAQPLAGCRGAEKGALLMKNGGDPAKNKLVWKWVRGDETTLDDFGNPTGTTAYAFCIYDGTNQLIGEVNVPDSNTLWAAAGATGYKYTDKTLANDGAKKVILKSGAIGKAKAILKGAGLNLPVPQLDPLALPLTTQLTNGSVCMQLQFLPVDVIASDTAKFKAKK